MANSIGYLQMVSQMSATEQSATAQEVGQGKVERGSKQRKELQVKVRELEDRANDLQAELAEVGDPDAWDNIVTFFTGKNDAADVGSKIAKNGAEMEKAAKEIQVVQAEIDQSMSELQTAQQELGGRVSDHQKVYDEQARAAQMAQQ